MIEWDWRIENSEEIIVGTGSDDSVIKRNLEMLIGKTVEAVGFCETMPELAILLSGALEIRTFTALEGQASWAIINNATLPTSWWKVEHGKIVESLVT